MKPAQWMAVVVLASMVGGITFAMVYLGGSRGPAKEQVLAPQASLTFAAKRYPEDGALALTSEVHQLAHQDFWFHNESKHSVAVGLNSKSCKCTDVELAIAPESWKPFLLATAAARVLQRAPKGLEDLPTLAATCQNSALFSLELPMHEVKTTALTFEDSVVVPAGRLGWVRLNWRGERPEPRILNADLWMNQRGSSLNAVLQVGVLIVEPMEVDKELSAGNFDLRELEKGKNVSIVCWSATRPSFRLKAELLEGLDKTASDPVEVGAPVPMNDADFQQLIKRSPRLQMQPLLSGYRIPVTLRARAKDGTPFGLGHFRRYVRLSSPDEGIEPVDVKVTGFAEGDVSVGSSKEGGVLTLGPFLSSRGARGSITVQTDVPGLQLALDAARIPAYLKVRFPREPEVTATGHRMWLLEVEVPPNAARGDFPRSDDPVYHDSAIYVKTNEKPPRSIRIPVRGAANEG
jgi:hypothetical protein